MSLLLRRKLHPHHARFAAVALIAALALAIGMAHSAMGSDHMGDAVAMCLAIGIVTAAVARTPRLGRQLPPRPRPPQQTGPHARSAVPAGSDAVRPWPSVAPSGLQAVNELRHMPEHLNRPPT